MSLVSFFTLLTVSITIFTFTEASKYGFSIEFLHRDSPNSPFYDPSETHSQRLQNSIRRSFTRAARHFNTPSSPNTASANIVSAQGEYLMNISIGTPPFQILAIADTGSDLFWTQCRPCEHCYKQDSPLFNPKNSSSYKKVSCKSSTCRISGGRCEYRVCQYSVQYGDQSYSYGVLGVDALTLGSSSDSSVSIPKMIFGCGTDNDGTFNAEGSGIIGLGGGPQSLVSQMGPTIGSKFSYCLVPLSNSSSSSKISFGSIAVVSGKGVVSTGLVQKSPKTFYFLTLEAISIGSEKLDFFNSTYESATTSTEGNMIIDSGTTLTYLPQEFYARVESALISQVKVARVEDPEQMLGLCYQFETEFEMPVVTAHFAGADLKLENHNVFLRVSENAVCFAFAPVEGFGIFGNVAQMNFLVGYDVKEMTVSFKPSDCTSQ